MTEITAEQLDYIAEEMATRVKEHIIVHAKETILSQLGERKDAVFGDQPTLDNVAVVYEMIFSTVELRSVMQEIISGRVKPLRMPRKADTYA